MEERTCVEPRESERKRSSSEVRTPHSVSATQPLIGHRAEPSHGSGEQHITQWRKAHNLPGFPATADKEEVEFSQRKQFRSKSKLSGKQECYMLPLTSNQELDCMRLRDIRPILYFSFRLSLHLHLHLSDTGVADVGTWDC